MKTVTDQNARRPVQRLVRKPYNQNCPKCGSRDINRRYRKPGDGVEKVSIDDELIERPPFLKVNWPYGWKAITEHIGQHCRTCQYDWESATLPNVQAEPQPPKERSGQHNQER